MSEEILFLTHKKSSAILEAIEKLRNESNGRKVTVLSHSVEFNVPGTDTNLFDDRVLTDLGFPVIGNSIVPGHAHFPVFRYISRARNRAASYWIIEYDVRFTGDWGYLLDHFSDSDAGLITSHIRRHAEEPDWPWWDLHHPEKEIPPAERIRSFNPIYRISSDAVDYLAKAFKSGWKGHNEVILPTLLKNGGFTITDMGGNGDYAESKNRFYTSISDKNGKLLTGTFRHKPPMNRAGYRQNFLYHPVKEEAGISPFRVLAGSAFRRARQAAGI
jgi:hypothetical protein